MANIKGFTIYFNVVEPYINRATDEQIGFAVKQALNYVNTGKVEYTGDPFQDTITDTMKGCVDYSIEVANRRGKKSNKPKEESSKTVTQPPKATHYYGDGTPMETWEEVSNRLKQMK